MRATIISILFILNALTLSAQMPPPDTVTMPELEITSALLNNPAGMISRQLDSLVLRSENTTSLADLLDTHASLFVKTEGRGALSTVSFRGTAASHTGVLWNGIDVRSPMLGQVDFSLFPVYLFDRISIHPGNSSMAETSGALGGAIRLDNTLSWPQSPEIKILTGLGSYHTTNNFVSVRAAGKKITSQTKAYFNYSKNDFSFKNKNIADIDSVSGEPVYPVQKNEHAEYRIWGAEQNLGIKIGNKGIMKMVYWFQKSDRSIPRLNTYEGDDHSNISRQSESVHRAILQYHRFLGKIRWSAGTGIIAQNMSYFLQNFIAGQGYQYAVNARSKIFSSVNFGQLQYRPAEKTLFKIKYQFDRHMVSTTDSIAQTGYERDRNEHRMLVSWQQLLGKRFATTVLIRQEWVDGKRVPLIPFAGFRMILSQKHNWTISGNIARNVNVPSLNDLYWQPGGNPDLKPEEGFASELSSALVIRKGNLKAKPRISFFYNDISQWIIWLPAPAGYWQAQNIDRVVARGMELTLNTGFAIKTLLCSLNLNYSYTRSENRGNPDVWGNDAIGKQLPYIPLHSGNILVRLQWKGFEIDYINNSYSERYTTSTNDVSRRDRLYPYFMNNLYLSKYFSFKRIKLRVQGKIYNLFNEEYRSVLGRPMPGRNYMLEVSVNI